MYLDEKALPELPVKLAPWRQHLLDAAQYIRDHGWCQDMIEDPNGKVCLVGAFKKAAGMPLRSPVYIDGNPALEAIKAVLNSNNFSGWNDKVGRTKEEVIAIFEQAAQHKLEDN